MKAKIDMFKGRSRKSVKDENGALRETLGETGSWGSRELRGAGTEVRGTSGTEPDVSSLAAFFYLWLSIYVPKLVLNCISSSRRTWVWGIRSMK